MNNDLFNLGYKSGYSDAEREQSETDTGKYVSFVSTKNVKLMEENQELRRKLQIARQAMETVLDDDVESVGWQRGVLRLALNIIVD